MMDKCIPDMMVELHTSSKIKRNFEVAVGVHVYVYNLCLCKW